MLTHELFDQVEAGFIYIDSDGVIQLFNRVAKQITGIIHGSGLNHSAGKIEVGDVVIIADSALGGDDGGLDNESLKTIGIDDPSIRPGNGLVAIGKFKADSSLSVYKAFR